MKFAAIFLTILAAQAQTPPAAGGPVALVRFQVAPQKGQPVTDLRPEDIEVREDGSARKIIALEAGAGKQHEIPIDIALLFDCNRMSLASGTLDPKLFHQGLLDEFPNAAIAIYGFAPGLTRITPPTRDPAVLAKAMDTAFLVHPLSTFLMDHISRVMIEAGSGEGAAVRLVVVVSTAQTDQGSASATQQQERYERAVAIAQRANVSGYPVLLIQRLATQDATPGSKPISGGGRVGGPQTASSEISASTASRAVGNFVSLGQSTGGKRLEVLEGGNMLATVLKQLAEEIRSGYIVGYEASASATPKPRKIEVVMRNKDRGKITTGAQRLVY